MSIVTMIVPFIVTGLVLTALALAWAYYKQTEAERRSPVDTSEPGGEP